MRMWKAEEKGSAPDTLLIRDQRSPLHSRCTAGDSPRPSRSPRSDFLSRPALHPAYAISHSVWWTTLSSSSFTRRGTEVRLFRRIRKKRSIGNSCAKCVCLPNDYSNGYRFVFDRILNQGLPIFRCKKRSDNVHCE